VHQYWRDCFEATEAFLLVSDGDRGYEVRLCKNFEVKLKVLTLFATIFSEVEPFDDPFFILATNSPWITRRFVRACSGAANRPPEHNTQARKCINYQFLKFFVQCSFSQIFSVSFE
jgi:hypothetical protein